MKTFLECLDEAAAITKAHHISAFIKLNLDEIHLIMLQAAADIYASQSKSTIPVVGGPASASVSEGEQLPAEGQGEANTRADFFCMLGSCKTQCGYCRGDDHGK